MLRWVVANLFSKNPRPPEGKLSDFLVDFKKPKAKKVYRRYVDPRTGGYLETQVPKGEREAALLNAQVQAAVMRHRLAKAVAAVRKEEVDQ